MNKKIFLSLVDMIANVAWAKTVVLRVTRVNVHVCVINENKHPFWDFCYLINYS